MTSRGEVNLNPYPLMLYGSASGLNLRLAEEVARLLKTKLSASTYKDFKNGEYLVHHTESVRDRDVYLIMQPRFGTKEELAYDTDECESMVFALRQGEPSRVTVVMPCLPYARQDRPSNHREPVLVQKIPMRLQMAGAHRLVTLRLHNPASYNAHPMTIPIVDVNLNELLIKHIKSKKFDLNTFKIVAPDLGAAPSCRRLARDLGIPENIIIINKVRDPKKANQNEVMEVIGEAEGYNCIIPDDMADTCGTAIKSLKALKEKGAKNVYFTATHAVLSGNAAENLNSAPFAGIWFSDTCLRDEDRKRIKNLEVISTGKMIAKIIDNLHNGKSVTELWHNGK